MYWGGLFDFKGNWKGPHVCHREGEEMDIGVSNFNGEFGTDKRKLLNRYLREDNKFYYPVEHESPDGTSNHWHIRLKK